jgi:hypothetical protein
LFMCEFFHAYFNDDMEVDMGMGNLNLHCTKNWDR